MAEDSGVGSGLWAGDSGEHGARVGVTHLKHSFSEHSPSNQPLTFAARAPRRRAPVTCSSAIGPAWLRCSSSLAFRDIIRRAQAVRLSLPTPVAQYSRMLRSSPDTCSPCYSTYQQCLRLPVGTRHWSKEGPDSQAVTEPLSYQRQACRTCVPGHVRVGY